MRRYSGIQNRFPGCYDQHRIVDRMAQLELTPEVVAQKSRRSGISVSEDTVMRAMSGRCGTVKKLWAIATVLEIEFCELFKFDPPSTEIHRVAVNGNSKGRSVTKGRGVGASARSL